MFIKDNLQKVCASLPEKVRLVAVSKTRSNEEILEVYHAGQKAFGENKVQELLRKQKELPCDIEWHLIGHLQTNKVKSVIPCVAMIHSVDSLKLLKSIDEEGHKIGRMIKCLLQVHIAQEETKFGFSPEELTTLLKSPEFAAMKSIAIAGVMGMATFIDNTEQIRQEFRHLSLIFNELKKNFFNENVDFREISMGMSDDYLIAIEEGSTLVRIGSSIFGPRKHV